MTGPYHRDREGWADPAGGRGHGRDGWVPLVPVPCRCGPAPMSRATATLLFTDLVGSTELRGRLGEEATDELRRRHDQLLTQAVEASNGRVVKGLGDGIMATFTGAADGVAAAVAIQQAIHRLNRTGKAPVPLAVRLGLSAGDVTFEGDDVHGTPVIEAARLCGAAVGGEILASEIVRWLSGAQRAPSFIPVGSLELKGLAAPVPAVRIEWEPAPVPDIPLPALLTDVGRIFVGRDAELARLGQLWKEAAAGERRVPLIAGEPGVGKTRLAAEVAFQVHGGGGMVLAGRCDEDLGVPYQPFVEALRHFVGSTPPADLRERLGRYGGELVRLLPELAGPVPDLQPPLRSDPETERYRLFDAVAAWLSAASADEPLLLVLDDMQWAAKPTLLLLRHIVRSSDARRLMVLGTYRDTELTHDHPLVGLVADLRREGVVERFQLSGLDDLAVAAIVEQAAGHALDEEGVALAGAIYHETEGNPFFVREVLRHLVETNTFERQGDRWATRMPIDRLGIPEGVRDVVGRRLARLSGEANSTLRVAAVVGAEFDARVVHAAGAFGEAQLLAGLDEAVEARLVIEVAPTRFRFSHALVRAALYESLTGTRKVALHRRVAEAIEVTFQGALEDHLPALAHHWARAAAPAVEAARAIDYAWQAGDRALRQLAHDEAVTYYGSALELLDSSVGPTDDSRRLELLLALGEAQRRAGDGAHRETLLGAARLAQKQGDTDALARAALANTRGVLVASFGAVDADRVAVLDSALSAVGGRNDDVEARLLASLGLELGLAGDRKRRRALSDAALTLASRLDDPATEVHVLMARHHTIAGPDTLAERRADTVQLMRACEALGDPVATCRACYLRVRLAMEQAQLAEAGRILDSWEAMARELGQPTLRWNATFARAAWSMSVGALSDAEAHIAESYQLGAESGQPDAALLHFAQLYGILFDQGRLAELRRPDEAMGENTAASSIPSVAAMRHCELDESLAARARLDDCQDFSDIPTNVFWSITMASWAVVVTHLADRDRALDLYRLLAPYPDQIAGTGTWWMGSIAHYLGMLAASIGDFDDADARFAAAEELHRRIGAPTWLARTHLEWARMLLTRRQPGDAEPARQLLGQALDSARELGLAKVERDAVALL
jgi:class 3 adenylate cyclase/tetratricopeptide (TPR) repeat protein